MSALKADPAVKPGRGFFNIWWRLADDSAVCWIGWTCHPENAPHIIEAWGCAFYENPTPTLRQDGVIVERLPPAGYARVYAEYEGTYLLCDDTGQDVGQFAVKDRLPG